MTRSRQVQLESFFQLEALNIDEAVNKIGFFGPNNEFIFCLTTGERFSIYNLQVEIFFSS